MIGNDWTRLVHRWLCHGQYGVNALLPLVAKQSGCTTPPRVKVMNDVDDRSCVADYRPTGGTHFLVVGSERADRPVKAEKSRAADAHDHRAVGVFFLVKDTDHLSAIDQAEPILDAVLASLKLLGDKGFIDKIEPPSSGGSWRRFGAAEVVELSDFDGLRLSATAQKTDAVAVAALFARLRGVRTTITPEGVA